jgi:hypothetical protein
LRGVGVAQQRCRGFEDFQGQCGAGAEQHVAPELASERLQAIQHWSGGFLGRFALADEAACRALAWEPSLPDAHCCLHKEPPKLERCHPFKTLDASGREHRTRQVKKIFGDRRQLIRFVRDEFERPINYSNETEGFGCQSVGSRHACIPCIDFLG